MQDKINKMFSKVSGSYDFINHLMSFNIDKNWRRACAEQALSGAGGKLKILDIAAGTGDLSITVAEMAASRGKTATIYASDFNKEMLGIAKKKISSMGLAECIKTEEGNAFEINHHSGTIDVLTSGFALRSFFFSDGTGKNMKKFLSEAYRVLKPGGRTVLLDMALPDNPSQNAFFRVYSNFMLFVGAFVDRETYGWLVKTITEFDKKLLKSMMEKEGFRNVKIISLKSGIAYLAYGEKHS